MCTERFKEERNAKDRDRTGCHAETCDSACVASHLSFVESMSDRHYGDKKPKKEG